MISRQMIKTSALAVMAVFMATAGQLLLKAGMDRVGRIGMDRINNPIRLGLDVIRTPYVLVGLALFVVSAGVWLIVLSRAPLSFAYPFAGFTYVLITLFARFVLKESIPGVRWMGILLIVVGIVTVARSAPPGLD